MIKVCDAIPGAGKTSAAIRYMNEHPEKRYVFITPYIEQADRIQASCPDLYFARPRNDLPEYKFRIRNHTAALLLEGKNISTTHEAFRGYTKEMLDTVRQMGYVLIIDESFDTLTECDLSRGDIEMLMDVDAISLVDGENEIYKLGGYKYDGRAYREFIEAMNSRNLVMCEERRKMCKFLFWMFPADMLLAFTDTIIMTYLFMGQDLYHMLCLADVSYENIYVAKDNSGYYFSDDPQPLPEYAVNLRNKVHILDDKKLNSVGERPTALSMQWFTKNKEDIIKLKNNLYNYFCNRHSDVDADTRMWSTYCKAPLSKLKGRGYTKGFLPFNARATNDFAHKKVLAYAVNLYMNVPKKTFLINQGVPVDEDMYALSTMIQWIWRSAIRNGEDIDIYIPSKRMRTLLINWMDELAKGGAH